MSQDERQTALIYEGVSNDEDRAQDRSEDGGTSEAYV